MFQTFEKEDLYPDGLDKRVDISYSLIKNYSFVDGNKRIGTLVLYLLLKENDYNIMWTDEMVVEIGLKVASGVFDKRDLKNYIEKRVKK